MLELILTIFPHFITQSFVVIYYIGYSLVMEAMSLNFSIKISNSNHYWQKKNFCSILAHCVLNGAVRNKSTVPFNLQLLPVWEIRREVFALLLTPFIRKKKTQTNI